MAINFGAFNPLSASSTNTIGQFSVHCMGSPISYTIVWGDGSRGAKTLQGSLNCLPAGSQRYPVYGSIPGLQNKVIAGNYSDSITLSMTY